MIGLMPKNVRRFEWAMYGSIALALIGFYWEPRLGSWRGLNLVVVLFAAIFFVFLWLLITWITSRSRNNLTKWLLVGMAVWGAIGYTENFQADFAHGAIWESIRFSSMLLRALALLFLFSGDAKGWFKPLGFRLLKVRGEP